MAGLRAELAALAEKEREEARSQGLGFRVGPQALKASKPVKRGIVRGNGTAAANGHCLFGFVHACNKAQLAGCSIPRRCGECMRV